MTNRDYAQLIRFDKDHPCMGIHKRLAIYMTTYGTHLLNYYIARLSHEIYSARGRRGHEGRLRIKNNLKRFADEILYGN